jgi:hypothetical protein
VADALRPCAAYFHVSSLISTLFAPYFLEPPPAKGSRLRVVGSDGVATFWDMDPALAARLERKLARLRGISCSITSYDSPMTETPDAL